MCGKPAGLAITRGIDVDAEDIRRAEVLLTWVLSISLTFVQAIAVISQSMACAAIVLIALVANAVGLVAAGMKDRLTWLLAALLIGIQSCAVVGQSRPCAAAVLIALLHVTARLLAGLWKDGHEKI